MYDLIEQLNQVQKLSNLEERVIYTAGATTPDDVLDLAETFTSLASMGVDLGRLIAAASALRPRVALAGPGAPVAQFVATFGAIYPPGAPAAPGTSARIVSQLPKTNRALGGNSAPTPESDRRVANWPIRSQGDRGTCVAHALAACREHLASEAVGHARVPSLSPQFCFWAAKRKGGDPNPLDDGTALRYAANGLAGWGVCHETDWRYDGRLGADVTQEGAGSPSPAALNNACSHVHQATVCMPTSPNSGVTQAIRQILLSKRRPVAISVGMLPDPKKKLSVWESPRAIRFGVVANPITGQTSHIGHAVCLTGFVRDPLEPNGGYFIFRNSWGTGWARDAAQRPVGVHTPEPGYGQISASHLEQYLWDYAVL